MDDLTKIVIGGLITGLGTMTLLWLKERRRSLCAGCPVKAMILGVVEVQIHLCEAAKIDCKDLWAKLQKMQEG